MAVTILITLLFTATGVLVSVVERVALEASPSLVAAPGPRPSAGQRRQLGRARGARQGGERHCGSMRCFTREVMLEGRNRPQPVLLLVGSLVAAILRGVWSAEGEVGVGVNTLQAKMQCVTRSLSEYTRATVQAVELRWSC